MPKGDGTGLRGQIAVKGTGRGRNGAGQWRGLARGPLATKPGGYCVCLGCGYSVQHLFKKPCNQLQCPKCGTVLTRG